MVCCFFLPRISSLSSFLVMEGRFRLFGLEQLYGFFKREVITVEILHVVTHLKDVVDDAAIDVALEEAAALLEHEVAAAQLTLLGKLGELLQEVFPPQVLL